MTDGPLQTHIIGLSISLHIDKYKYHIVFLFKLFYLSDYHGTQLSFFCNAIIQY